MKQSSIFLRNYSFLWGHTPCERQRTPPIRVKKFSIFSFPPSSKVVTPSLSSFIERSKSNLMSYIDFKFSTYLIPSFLKKILENASRESMPSCPFMKKLNILLAWQWFSWHGSQLLIGALPSLVKQPSLVNKDQFL